MMQRNSWVSICQGYLRCRIVDQRSSPMAWTFRQHARGFQETSDGESHHRPPRPSRRSSLIVEPTGGYELALGEKIRLRAALATQSCPTLRQDTDWPRPRTTRKTDQQDAMLLARIWTTNQPHLWTPLPEAVAGADRLLRRRMTWNSCSVKSANRPGWLSNSSAGVRPACTPSVNRSSAPGKSPGSRSEHARSSNICSTIRISIERPMLLIAQVRTGHRPKRRCCRSSPDDPVAHLD